MKAWKIDQGMGWYLLHGPVVGKDVSLLRRYKQKGIGMKLHCERDSLVNLYTKAIHAILEFTIYFTLCNGEEKFVNLPCSRTHDT